MISFIELKPYKDIGYSIYTSCSKRTRYEMTQQSEENSSITGEVQKLIELVDYQTGSVVSRTIIDKKTGTCTLFAFAEGEGLSEHTTPFDALVYLLDGEAEITISGKPHILKTGDTIIMPANEPHALRAQRQFKMMLVMIKS